MSKYDINATQQQKELDSSSVTANRELKSYCNQDVEPA